jgi:tetraacyldisaccharide 4'-kinase
MYQTVTGTRNWMYDRGLFKEHPVAAKVISIGNLTVGGTGKTPVTLAVVDYLKKKNKSVGVISRGYKREDKGVLEVDTSPAAGQKFGDEPALIKFLHPDIPVVVGERRVLAAQEVLSKTSVDLLVCDDAFQHRSLRRDLNILLFDATEPLNNYRVMPVGRARESIQPALRRADVVVLTKANFIDPSELEQRRKWIKDKTQKPLVEADWVFKGLRSHTGEIKDSLKDAGLLVSGVAKPETIERTLNGKVKIVKHRKFGDHHRYTDLEVETILDEASAMQARWILTTGKDAMKLSAFNRMRDRLWVIELGLELKGDVKAFYEAIDGLARQSR